MEWKEVRLGDVCNIITGFPFPGKNIPKKEFELSVEIM